MAMPEQLSEALILECADRLGASFIPIEAIQLAWAAQAKSLYGWGCLNNESGQRLFVAYRLRDLGCFEVGCQEDETRLTVELNCFDIYSDTKNLTEEEFAEFMYSRSKYRQNEARVAATKLWKLLDSQPVNAVADRATYYRRDSKG